MKIVFINQPQDSLVAGPEQRGSVAIVNWELARQLSQRHEVIVYAPRVGNQPLRENWGGIEIRRVRFVAKRFHKGMQLLVGRLSRNRHYFDSAVYFREYYLQVARDLAACSPDIIHLPQQLQFVPLLRRRTPGAKLVVHMHQDELAHLDYDRARQYLSTLDAVVTVSDYVTTRARTRFPEFAGRIHTIGNGVDVNRFQPGESKDRAQRKVRLLFVGRVSPDKGVHLLIDAFDELARERADLELTVVGRAGMLPFDILALLLRDDAALESLRGFYGRSFWGWLTNEVFGQKASYVEALRARLSARTAGRVRFTGAISLPELIRAYQESDLLVLPSIWHESYGLPVAEAMASGVAVLASRCGGIPELVDEYATGLLTPRNEPHALVAALRALTQDPVKLRAMGVAARARAVSKLTWGRSALCLEQVYQGLLGQEGAESTGETEPQSQTRATEEKQSSSLWSGARAETSVSVALLIVLAACTAPTAWAQSIARDVIIDSHFPKGQPLEKAIDYFSDTKFPSVVVGNVSGGIYLYRSLTGTLEGPWQRTDIVATGAAYERARPIRFPGDAYPGLVASIDNKIVLFENPKNTGDAAGIGRPWPSTVINSTYGCHDLQLEDLDGDGKIDIVCSGALNLLATEFVAFQNDRSHWRVVYSVAGVSEGVAVIRIGADPLPHLVGSDRTGNVFWFENPRSKGGDPRSPSWVPHYIGPGNVGNSFAVVKFGKLDAVVTASNEHEGPGDTPDARGITWYEQPANPLSQWIVHSAESTYRDVHEINAGHWNSGVPYFIAAEQENACEPARPAGNLPSHQGLGCRITMFQWLNGQLRATVLAPTSTHNQAVLPWGKGLLMADANHGAYGAPKDIHVRFITP